MGSTMGKSGGNFLDALPTQGTLHVVMLGLDSAGKTTALYRLKFDQYLNTVPTIGFNCEKVQGTVGKAKGIQFLVWDVGGQEKLRPLWRSYTRCTDGILFVVDSVDVERMEEAKMELMRTAKCPDNQGVPVLILANKQDLPGARDPKELEKLLGLNELQYPALNIGSVSMQNSSSASTGNIVGCNAGSGKPNFCSGTVEQQQHVSDSSVTFTGARSQELATQHSRSFGGYGVSVSSSSSITKDVCMQHKTKKLYSSSSSTNTLIMEQHHLHDTDGASTLGVGSFGTFETKTTPSSIATTPTATTATLAVHTLPPQHSTSSLSKKWHGGTSGASVTTAALATSNTLQYKGWYIQPACAITGEGLQEGLEALYEMILKRRKLNKTFKKKR